MFYRSSIILMRGKFLLHQFGAVCGEKFDNKPLNSPSSKFLKTDGLSFDHTARSGGNGPTNSITHS